MRCDGLDGDETNGFFVSLFVRKRALRTSKDASEAPSVTHDAGLPVYAGEFASEPSQPPADSIEECERGQQEGRQKCQTIEKESPSTQQRRGPNEKPKESDTKSTHSRRNQAKKNEASSTKGSSDKISARKREKKLAWKRKQAMLKAQRLKKKEGEKEASNKGGAKLAEGDTT